jgi:cytochrome P450
VTSALQLPFDQPVPFQVAPVLRRLQGAGPIHRVRTAVGCEAWLVTSYDEVRRLLDDSRLGRAHPNPADAARTGESALFGGPLGEFETEHADHARMRALLQPHFSPKRMRALRPRVDQLTAAFLDDLAEHGPPADLHATVALPLPIAVFCELLGVPFEDRAQLRVWTQAAGDVCDRSRSEQGLAELFGYGRELVARKRREPGDDVITRLSATAGVADDEAAAMAMFLLFAGHETTVVAIGVGAVWLLTEPDQWQRLRADPTRLGPVVEEMLRIQGTGGGGVPRYARTDMEIAGVGVRDGDLVLLDIGAANHDESAFPDPDRFEPDRRAADGHLAFGHGARYCIGAPLARVELRAVFSQLLSRFPELRLAVEPGALRFNTDVLTGGVRELPVAW